MARSRSFFFQYKYFISAIRYSVILENPENMGKPMINTIKEHNLDSNISWRFKKTEKGGLEIDLSQVNTNTSNEPIWVTVNPKVTEITKAMIKEGLSDEEITSKIYSRLMEGGVTMENKKITKNISADIGNNYAKVAIDDKVFSFVNKARKERQVNKLADNDFITLNDDLGYYVIANEDDEFEQSQSKKDKNFMPTLFYSVCKALSLVGVDAEEVDVNLSMLTPINQADEAKEYIEKIKEKDSCMCTYRIDNNEDTLIVNIKNIEMFLEGVASLPLIENHKGMQAVVDVGSITVNIIKSRNSRILTVDTIDDLGAFEYYDKLINKINNRSVNISNIQQLIEDGIYSHDKEILKAYLKKVLNETNKVIKFDTCVNINFTGGAMELFKSQGLNFEKENIKIMNDPVFSNVKGSKVFLDTKYKIAAGE